MRVGTIVALVATALLAIAIATPWWWSGHPSFDGGQPLNRKAAHIGLITASQCNQIDDEDTECKHLSVGGTLKPLKFVHLGVAGLLAVSLLGLAISRDRRKGVAKLTMVAVIAATVMGVVLLSIGPDLKPGSQTSMPVGLSFILFFVGSGLAIVSSVLGLLPPRAARPPGWVTLPPQPAMPAAHAPPHQQYPAFDVEALLAEDALRPAALGPEPMMGVPPRSPGGSLPGPAGPLGAPPGAPSGPQPLFNSAPQLRPLYEANNNNFVPPAPPPVQFPMRGPTPMPQPAVSALLGTDGPPATAIPVPPLAAPPPPRMPPPPTRTKPLSAAPPIPAIPPRAKPPTKPPPPRPVPTLMSAAVPPPPADTGDHVDTVDYKKQSLDANLPYETTSEARPFGGEEDTSADASRTADDTSDDLETAARNKFDNTDVELVQTARDSSTDATSARAPSKVPISTAPESLPPPPTDDALPSGPSPACPQCEAPMTWVEEHLRFYCKSCRMYF